jgi:tRNA (guanine-N7-)-methyltransferase
MGRPWNEYPDHMLNLATFAGQIDFAQVFGRNRAVHIEVGSGKGTFLVHEASAQPQVNFVGIEWARKYYRQAVDRIGRWGLTNVRLVRAEAAAFLAEFVRDESVDCFHIYFPDPWPKRRHHKRRLLQPSTIETLIRCLKPLGEIRVATDHAEYFAWIEGAMSAYSTKLEWIEFTRPAGAREGERTGTNYERKYLRGGRPVYVLAVRKTG